MGDLVNESVNDTYDLSISEFRALTIDQKDEETWCDQQEAEDPENDLLVTQLTIPDKFRNSNHDIEGK